MRLPSSSGPDAAASLPPPREVTTGSRASLVVLTGLVLVTVGIIRISDGNLVASLAPALIALTVWGIWSLPLRVPMLVLLALAWGIESPGDVFADGKVETPWGPLGRVLWAKLNLFLPIPALVTTGFDFLAVLLFAVVLHRHLRRSTIDREGWVSSASPIALFAWVSLGGLAWLGLFGLVRGGEFRFVLWQSTKWLYLPVIYALMQQALRGPQDAPLVGRVVLGVGLFRAIEAIVLRLRFPSKELMTHATAHHDSVLFATCLAILVASLLEMPRRRILKASLLLAPIYLWAMVANNRRLVWLELILVLVFFFLISPWRPLKIKVTRIMVLGFVPFLLYAAAGWDSEAKIFVPILTLRSVIDSKKDLPSLWRDLENYPDRDLKENPLLGSVWPPHGRTDQAANVTDAYELEPHSAQQRAGDLGLRRTGRLHVALVRSFRWSLLYRRAYHYGRTPLNVRRP
jgi:hypothetical protein